MHLGTSTVERLYILSISLPIATPYPRQEAYGMVYYVSPGIIDGEMRRL